MSSCIFLAGFWTSAFMASAHAMSAYFPVHASEIWCIFFSGSRVTSVVTNCFFMSFLSSNNISLSADWCPQHMLDRVAYQPAILVMLSWLQYGIWRVFFSVFLVTLALKKNFCWILNAATCHQRTSCSRLYIIYILIEMNSESGLFAHYWLTVPPILTKAPSLTYLRVCVVFEASESSS